MEIAHGKAQDIPTKVAFKSGNRYVSQGYFEGAGGATFFNCWFDLSGNFQSVN